MCRVSQNSTTWPMTRRESTPSTRSVSPRSCLSRQTPRDLSSLWPSDARPPLQQSQLQGRNLDPDLTPSRNLTVPCAMADAGGRRMTSGWRVASLLRERRLLLIPWAADPSSDPSSAAEREDGDAGRSLPSARRPRASLLRPGDAGEASASWPLTRDASASRGVGAAAASATTAPPELAAGEAPCRGSGPLAPADGAGRASCEETVGPASVWGVLKPWSLLASVPLPGSAARAVAETSPASGVAPPLLGDARCCGLLPPSLGPETSCAAEGRSPCSVSLEGLAGAGESPGGSSSSSHSASSCRATRLIPPADSRTLSASSTSMPRVTASCRCCISEASSSASWTPSSKSASVTKSTPLPRRGAVGAPYPPSAPRPCAAAYAATPTAAVCSAAPASPASPWRCPLAGVAADSWRAAPCRPATAERLGFAAAAGEAFGPVRVGATRCSSSSRADTLILRLWRLDSGGMPLRKVTSLRKLYTADVGSTSSSEVMPCSSSPKAFSTWRNRRAMCREKCCGRERTSTCKSALPRCMERRAGRKTHQPRTSKVMSLSPSTTESMSDWRMTVPSSSAS
mmetsp:Transcript_15549/g.58979  ORF Transcript_15549/g.58979 Transcript_15549/m.58979 type:complete len:571 (+) Transcript_15549:697-2409(+)